MRTDVTVGIPVKTSRNSRYFVVFEDFRMSCIKFSIFRVFAVIQWIMHMEPLLEQI